MPINVFDPNQIIVNNIPNGIPSFENIRSFVSLSMKPKNSNYIVVEQVKNGNKQTNNVIEQSKKGGDSTIFLNGTFQRNNTNYYSTNYTDEIMGGTQTSYEGFGMKSVELTFNANNIPQVTIVFYDLRGNVLSNIDSKFSKMFQLPYPIFELKIKGGFGPEIQYTLLKTRDDITIDEQGNFIITSKFIGAAFAPLSDVPLLYLMAVPWLKKLKNPAEPSFSVTDNNIENFFELIQSTKRLYELIRTPTDNEANNERNFKEQNDKLTNLNNIKEELLKNEYYIDLFNNDDNFNKNFNQNDRNIILNYVKSFVIQNNIIKPNILLKLNKTVHNFIITTLQNDINNKNQNLKDLKSKTTISPIQKNMIILNENVPVFSEINLTKLDDEIKVIKKQLIDNAYNFRNEKNARFLTDINTVLGNTDLTVGKVFKFMFDDYNYLLEQIFIAGNEGTTKNANSTTLDRMGFPTVINANKIIYPGNINEYKEWPEVILIEQFIDSYYQSVKTSALLEISNAKNENGSSKYIPINPREIYGETKEENLTNIYFSQSNNIFNLMYQRFLCFANVNILMDVDENEFNRWNNTENIENDWLGATKSLFGLTKLSDTVVKRNIFYSVVEMEARNIAYALLTDEKLKRIFIQLGNVNDIENFIKNTPNHELTKGIELKDQTVVKVPTSIKIFDDNYVTVSENQPQLISDISESSTDIITTFMKRLNDVDDGVYKITKDNVLYVTDNKLNGNNNESDYDINKFFSLKQQIATKKRIEFLYDNVRPLNVGHGINFITFNLFKLYDQTKYPALVQIPRALAIILGSIIKIKNIVDSSQNLNFYYIPTDLVKINSRTSFENCFFIKPNTSIYNFILNESNKFDNEYGFLTTFIRDNDNIIESISCKRNNFTKKTDEEILEYLYQPIYLSINDQYFTKNPDKENFTLGFTNTSSGNKSLYTQYLKLLLPKIAQFIKDDEKQVQTKLEQFTSYVNDNDVKLSVYKSFQLIYQNYLYGKQKEDEYKLYVTDDDTTSFKFVDRGYNNISGLDNLGCILDLKTLLNDSNDYEVSILSSISRLLADNNFWFYPFQTFFTSTGKYKELFKINFDLKDFNTKPLFFAMYVGGLSSNPNVPNFKSNYLNDGILKDGEIPDDMLKGGTLDAFSVNYTGIQNQSIFSNIQISTESLKNTDEGLRIQSEIVNNASNNYSIPKGQSLLNVYQKQSYSTTVKIPFGNVGIQPTQYFYQSFIPLFEGLYIIFNVSHTIDSDTQRLETTFKGYRLKKDVNPIVTHMLVDYINNDIYNDTLLNLGIQTQISTVSLYNPSLKFLQNARNFVIGNEGFVPRIYWDINNWRTGYGTQTLALNASLKASESERLNPNNFKKYYINLPNDRERWPRRINLDTGAIEFHSLKAGHVETYAYNKLSNGVQWDANRRSISRQEDPNKGFVVNFYTKELADIAFDYDFTTFLKNVRKINATGFDNLSERAQIGVTYIAYGFGSIKTFMTKIKSGIASGNDLQLTIGIIEDLVLGTGDWSKQLYYNTAKYIEPNIYTKVSQEIQTKLKSKNITI